MLDISKLTCYFNYDIFAVFCFFLLKYYLQGINRSASDNTRYAGRNHLAGRRVDAARLSVAAGPSGLAQHLLVVLGLLGEVVVLDTVGHGLALQVLRDHAKVLRML